MIVRTLWLSRLLVATSLLGTTAQAAPAAADLACIEQQIQRIEQRRDAVFIRNGKEYSASQAARFLRGKRDAHLDEIRSCQDFLQRLASQSSTTGQPYRIRDAKGQVVLAAQFWASKP